MAYVSYPPNRAKSMGPPSVGSLGQPPTLRTQTAADWMNIDQLTELSDRLPTVALRDVFWACAGREMQAMGQTTRLSTARALHCYQRAAAQAPIDPSAPAVEPPPALLPEEPGPESPGIPRWVWIAGAAVGAVVVVRLIAK